MVLPRGVVLAARARARCNGGMSESAQAVSTTATVVVLAAFTKDGAGGNPAGVVLDAEALSPGLRQRIATAVGAPETAFVRDAGDPVFEVEFFTPNRQVPDCGHATVATFGWLVKRGILRAARATKRTIIGDRAIFIEGERVFMEQPRPTIAPFARTAEIAKALGIDDTSMVGEPVIADHGVRFVLAEVSRDALVAAVPDQRAIEALTEPDDAIGVYVYARDAGAYDATARMFAPRYGIPEESATGMAAGLLGGYLARDAARAEFRFVQGELSPLNAPSELIVHVEPERVLVGGTASVLRTLLMVC
jgi:PhzF family phenazine biosynthesis protein